MENEPEVCPLCKQAKHMHKARPLYGNRVCKKCYYGFANRRQLAYFVDFALLWALGKPATIVLGFAFVFVLRLSGLAAGQIQAMLAPITWTIDIFLFALFACKDGFGGRSPGKFLCGVKTMDAKTGRPIGFFASFKRNLPLVVPFMPLIVAFRLPSGHRTGDGWSRSMVVWKKYATHPVFWPDAF